MNRLLWTNGKRTLSARTQKKENSVLDDDCQVQEDCKKPNSSSGRERRVIGFPPRATPLAGRGSLGGGTEAVPTRTLHLHLDVDARGKLERHQGIDGFRVRFVDVEQPFVHADFVLVARVLMDER